MADLDLSKATDAEIVKHLMGTKRINVYHYHTMINAIAALRTAWQPRWIPVEERLPEGHQRVVAFGPADAVRFADFVDRQFFRDGMAIRPTHWMPLPPAPKGGAS